MDSQPKNYHIPYEEAHKEAELWRTETSKLRTSFELKSAHVFDIESIKQLLESLSNHQGDQFKGINMTHVRFYHGIRVVDGKKMQSIFAVGAYEDPATGKIEDIILSKTHNQSGIMNVSRPCPPWCSSARDL